MLIAEKFIRSLVENYGKHIVYTDGGTWYDEACNVLRLKHYLYSSFEKSLMERVNPYFKDRIEGFDDYYPCIRNGCTLFHVYNWIHFLFLCTIVLQQQVGMILILSLMEVKLP